MTKLHLGCGSRYLEGYINIDLGYYKLDENCDVRDLSRYEDNSIDEIYASHVLEYLDKEGAIETLKEWYRVLKPSGIIRIAVPDFDKIIEVYQKYGDIEHMGILGPLYGKMQCGEDYIYHKIAYNYSLLYRLLKKVGFKNIRKYEWRDFLPKWFDDYSKSYIPHLDFDEGMLISLNVEAEK